MRDLAAERRKGVRFVELLIGGFAGIFLTIWFIFVFPLFFEAPHPVTIPALYGVEANFPTSGYVAAEVAGTAFYCAMPLGFVGLGIYTYLRMRADLPRLIAQTEANRAARRALEAREAAESSHLP